MLDLEKIKLLHKQKKNFRIETYIKILQMVIKMIEMTAITGESCCLYEVPEFILGEPNYDIKECCEYIVKELKKHKLQDVSYYEPNVIFITWKFD